jgi:hypothetical protein
MALKVIGAGFGRTGTLSLKIALEQLGYAKCHHMMEVFRSPEQGRLWKAIADGDTPDWNAVFAGFESSVDFPSSIFYRELAEKYPDAKVVLTVRSADSWYKSASETIFAIGKVTPSWLKTVAPHLGRIFAMHEKLLWARVFGKRTDDPAHAKAVFERHNAAVQAAMPADRLLVYEVKQGWGPLCAFLGKPIPETPFPNVNDTAEFQAYPAYEGDRLGAMGTGCDPRRCHDLCSIDVGRRADLAAGEI